MEPITRTSSRWTSQLEHIYNSFVWTQVVVWRSCRKPWIIEANGERMSGKFVLVVDTKMVYSYTCVRVCVCVWTRRRISMWDGHLKFEYGHRMTVLSMISSNISVWSLFMDRKDCALNQSYSISFNNVYLRRKSNNIGYYWRCQFYSIVLFRYMDAWIKFGVFHSPFYIRDPSIEMDDLSNY